MAQQDGAPREATVEEGLTRGVVLLVIIGVVLGVVYNFAGLLSRPAYGLPWIAVREELPELEPMLDQREGPAAERAIAPEIPSGLGHPLQVQLAAVKRLFDAGDALIVDAREAEDYARGHIAGAINIPYETAFPEVVAAIDSGGRPIITYCEGGTCEVSMNLGWDLVNEGHDRVLVFMGGLPEWETAGYPIETGKAEAASRVAGGATGGGADLTTDIDDPMAFFAPAQQPADLPPIPEMDRPIKLGIANVKRFFDARAALILDARDLADYAQGHIPGAVNLPYSEVVADPGLLNELEPDGKPIIAYCGGGTCEESINLAHALVSAGHRKVLIYMGGMPEWEAAGYPVERDVAGSGEAS